MVELGRMETYRITRMKLGFPVWIPPEFSIDMESQNMTQLDNASSSVVTNENDIEGDPVGFNSN